jgi:DNA invertase Pin-like site-specific DNA recombinase
MVAKGRGNSLKGEHNPRAKLTRNEVVEIRQLLAVGVLQRNIAASFGIGQTQVSRIKRGVSYVGGLETTGKF